jgi:hypothetical protein
MPRLRVRSMMFLVAIIACVLSADAVRRRRNEYLRLSSLYAERAQVRRIRWKRTFYWGSTRQAIFEERLSRLYAQAAARPWRPVNRDHLYHEAIHPGRAAKSYPRYSD